MSLGSQLFVLSLGPWGYLLVGFLELAVSNLHYLPWWLRTAGLLQPMLYMQEI